MIAEERAARGRLDSPRTNGVPQRPAIATSQAQERRAASSEEQATADERVRGASRHAAPLGVSGRPERGKAQGSTDRRRIDRRLEMAGTDGSKPRRRTAVAIQSAARSRVRESGSVRRPIPRRKLIGAVETAVNDRWASAANNADGTVRPEQSCEGSNPMSGAGWRATIQCPPRRPGGKQIARAETGTPGRTQAAPRRMSQRTRRSDASSDG